MVRYDFKIKNFRIHFAPLYPHHELVSCTNNFVLNLISLPLCSDIMRKQCLFYVCVASVHSCYLCLHGSMPGPSAEHKGCRHGKSVALHDINTTVLMKWGFSLTNNHIIKMLWSVLLVMKKMRRYSKQLYLLGFYFKGRKWKRSRKKNPKSTTD